MSVIHKEDYYYKDGKDEINVMAEDLPKIFDKTWDTADNPALDDALDAMAGSPMEGQVGGKHYKDLAIQPVEYISKNNLSYLQGSVIKYTTRYKSKGGVEDLQKAIHFLQMMIHEEENKI